MSKLTPLKQFGFCRKCWRTLSTKRKRCNLCRVFKGTVGYLSR